MSAASSTRSKRSRPAGNDSPRPRDSASYQPARSESRRRVSACLRVRSGPGGLGRWGKAPPQSVTAEVLRIRRSLRRQPPDRVIAQVLGRDMFVPEPGVSRVLLIPSLAIAPIVHRFDHHELQIICHPVTPAVGEPDAPPPILLQLTRALGDERRLRILRMLATDRLTAVELAERLDTSLTTLAHHLGLLRGAGLLVANQPGRKRYRSNPEALRMLHELLGGYLMPADPSGSAPVLDRTATPHQTLRSHSRGGTA